MMSYKNFILNRLLLTALLLVLATDCFAKKQADIYTSVTTARRVVVNENIQAAKQKAETDALGVALQNAFSMLLPNQVVASNLDFFYNNIFPRVKDYIITYKVLGGVKNRGHYLVGIESKIDIRLLKKTLTDARIINAGKDRPVVMFFLSEQTPSDLEPRIWWQNRDIEYYSLAEQMIANQMTREQFMVIGNSQQRPDPTFYNIIFRSVSDIGAAVSLGRQMKADMIIMGSAVAQEAINRMGEEKAFNANITLSGYNLETGERVVDSSVEAVVTSYMEEQGIQDAIVKASELSSRDLIDKINLYWIENLRKEHSFMVRIEGENFHPRYLALTQRFKQMPGIENMQPKEIGSNHGLLEMFYKGDSSKFANALMLKTFDDFGFEFVEVTDELVFIRLIQKTEEKPDSEDSNPEEQMTEEPQQ